MPGQLLLEAASAGGYVSPLKPIPLLLLLLLWARLLTWTDKDAVAAHLPRVPLNLANLSGLIVGFALFFMLPVQFFVAFLVPLFIALVEIGVYLGLRQRKVGLSDLGDQFKEWMQSFARKKDDKDKVWQVQVAPKNGAPMPAPEKEDPERPAFEAVQFALTDPLKKNSDQIDMSPSATGLLVKYAVDGVSYDGATIDGTNGASAITMLKELGGMSVEERRKPQTGIMKVTFEGKRREVKLQSAGTTAGEFLRLIIEPSKRHALTLDQLGLTEVQLATVKESIKDSKGLVLVGAPKGQGLTSLTYGVLRAHDAYLQHIQSIERSAEQDLEGITQNKLDAGATAAEEAKQADWVTSQEPNVLLMDKVEDPRTAATLAKFATEERRAYVAIRATSGADALEQWRKVCGDDEVAFGQLKLVVVGRVLRKLCDACKESYSPDPNTLRKLNLNPEKVSTLFKAREQPLRDPKGNPIPCTFCHDLRFKGRTGVYEIVVVDDEMREALKRDAAAGRIGAQFKVAFRKQRGRYLQEEALGLVEKGETSVQEVLRVLRGGEESSASESSSSAPSASRPAAAARPAPAARAAARRSSPA